MSPRRRHPHEGGRNEHTDCIDWRTAPAATRAQVDRLVAAFRDELQDHLLGVYLHGSLATGCFNPKRSDVDLLVVVRRPFTQEQKRRLVGDLLSLSRSPHPVEISFLRLDQLHPWRHPAPFELHYSEDWRASYLGHQEGGPWPIRVTKDADLAAHVAVTRARGIRLWGRPRNEVFPAVPAEDVAASLVSDFVWARERLAAYPVYAVLNACRIHAYFLTGRLLSKVEGAAWAREHFPEDLTQVVEAALQLYRGSGRDAQFSRLEGAQRLFDHVAAALGKSPRTDA